MPDLARLTVDDFAPLVGEAFEAALAEAERHPLELVEARLVDATKPSVYSDGGRAPFTLLFRGPAQTILPQQIYRLEHSGLGAIEIFIVPVGRSEAGTTYEAVFT
jgi:hypothetical protein